VSDTILLVDDDAGVRDVVAFTLRREGFEVDEERDGPSALESGRSGRYSLVVLDVMLPGLSGVEVCRALRAESDVPILMLTARDAESDRVLGLELGADDYVTKPFSPRELSARVRTVLRRATAPQPSEQRLTFGELDLDTSTREVKRDGRLVQLTAREFDLLWFLASHPRQVFSRDQLMDRVWGYEAAVDTGTVTVHIRRLREKIEADPAQPRRLETVWGVGYRFVP
jgi:DNA-binding response OmpR family regulator